MRSWRPGIPFVLSLALVNCSGGGGGGSTTLPSAQQGAAVTNGGGAANQVASGSSTSAPIPPNPDIHPVYLADLTLIGFVPATQTTLNPVGLPNINSDVRGIAYSLDGTRVYVDYDSDRYGAGFASVNTTTNQIVTVAGIGPSRVPPEPQNEPGNFPTTIVPAPTGGLAYVLDRSGIDIIDPNNPMTSPPAPRIPFPAPGTTTDPTELQQMVVSPDGTTGYVTVDNYNFNNQQSIEAIGVVDLVGQKSSTSRSRPIL